MSNRKRCPICGAGHVEETNLKGTVARYKDEPELPVEEDVFVPKCDACGEVFFREEYTRAYEQVLRKSYETKRLTDQQQEIRRALEVTGANQSQLEEMLGLSQGYVSKLLSGEKITSATTIRFLHVLGSVPEAAESLKEYRGMPGSGKGRPAAVAHH